MFFSVMSVRQKVKTYFLPVYLGFEGKASFAFKPLKPNAKPARSWGCVAFTPKKGKLRLPFFAI
ncbi:MAG: hypothetical protein LBC37_01125 [Zoogloeaceae bacterium]|jgi:hypothetical protein|nr:hypothetical protein [Zoogloeaceae bacterium]